MISTPALAEPILRLEPGACNLTTETLGCYDATGQTTLQAILKRAKKCEIELSEVSFDLMELASEPAWYENQWLWFSVGLVIGAGSGVAIAALH